MIERLRDLSIGMAALEPDARCGHSNLGDGYLNLAAVLILVTSLFFVQGAAAISSRCV